MTNKRPISADLIIPAIVIPITLLLCLIISLRLGHHRHERALADQALQYKINHVVVPDLNDPTMIRIGAGQYAEHCARCHSHTLGHNVEPAVLYAIIRRGSSFGMPAFVDHDNDYSIWSTIAFIQQDLSGHEYDQMVDKAPPNRPGLVEVNRGILP